MQNKGSNSVRTRLDQELSKLSSAKATLSPYTFETSAKPPPNPARLLAWVACDAINSCVDVTVATTRAQSTMWLRSHKFMKTTAMHYIRSWHVRLSVEL